MPSKEQILAAVSQALEAMGVSDGAGEDAYGEGEGVSGDNSVPIWSKLQAGSLGSSQGTIHDKSLLMQTMKEQNKPPMTDAYGMPVDDEGAEMMTTMGLV